MQVDPAVGHIGVAVVGSARRTVLGVLGFAVECTAVQGHVVYFSFRSDVIQHLDGLCIGTVIEAVVRGAPSTRDGEAALGHVIIAIAGGGTEGIAVITVGEQELVARAGIVQLGVTRDGGTGVIVAVTVEIDQGISRGRYRGVSLVVKLHVLLRVLGVVAAVVRGAPCTQPRPGASTGKLSGHHDIVQRVITRIGSRDRRDRRILGFLQRHHRHAIHHDIGRVGIPSRRHGILHRDGLRVGRGIVASVRGRPSALHLVATRCSIIHRGLPLVDRIDHLEITRLAVVRCRHFGDFGECLRAIQHEVGRSFVESRRRVVVTLGHTLEHLKNIGHIVGTDADAGHPSFTRVVIGLGAGQVNEDVTHGTSSGLTEDGSLPAEPTACTVVAVAVIGLFANLESEELVIRSMAEAEQASTEGARTHEVAHAVVHVVDVPIHRLGVDRGTIRIVLQTTTVGHVSAIGSLAFVHNENLPLFGGIGHALNRSGQDGGSRFSVAVQLQAARCGGHIICG